MRVMLDREPEDDEHDTNSLQVGDVVRLVGGGARPRPAHNIPNGTKGVVTLVGAHSTVGVTFFLTSVQKVGGPQLRRIPQSVSSELLERIP